MRVVGKEGALWGGGFYVMYVPGTHDFQHRKAVSCEGRNVACNATYQSYSVMEHKQALTIGDDNYQAQHEHEGRQLARACKVRFRRVHSAYRSNADTWNLCS